MARQYCGTAGQVENCQIGAFLAYAGARGYTQLDAELYLSGDRPDEPTRLQDVGLAPDTPFAAKPAIGQRPGRATRANAGTTGKAWC
ncbi:MAG: hypothetical protein J4G06_04455 [Caldilineaceae bacterium]|nr:hypothetical protein [Caldilineaceae bacterium]